MAKPAPKLEPVPSGPNAAAEEPPKKKSKKKLLLVLAGLLILGGGGGGAAWYFMKGNTAHAAKKPEPPKPPVFVTLENFTVNLQPEAGEQYLQVTVVVKVADSGVADLIKLHMPEVRNRILLLLSSKKASELSTVQGKEKLSNEIVALLKKPFFPQGTSQAIDSVLFTSFVIQ